MDMNYVNAMNDMKKKDPDIMHISYAFMFEQNHVMVQSKIFIIKTSMWWCMYSWFVEYEWIKIKMICCIYLERVYVINILVNATLTNQVENGLG